MEENTKRASIAECISVLENLRERTRHYTTMFPHYPDDYLADLITTEHSAIDTIISILKSLEK